MAKSANFNILIVDDNENNLYTLRTLIDRHLDVGVLEASSGMDALDIALGESKVDIIVLDVQMPEMDGFQTASMLKIRKKTQDIPIIFLTAAFKAHEFQQKGYEVGGVDYLLKPIDDNLLINKISTYIRLIEKERDMNKMLEAKVQERTQELAQAKQYLEKIIQTMGEALLVLNAEGVIRDANPTACKLLAYTPEDLRGMSIGEVFEEENQEKAAAFMGTWLEAVIRSGVLTSIEASFIASDQCRIPILFSRTVMQNETGGVESIICIAKDMTGYQKIQSDDD